MSEQTEPVSENLHPNPAKHDGARRQWVATPWTWLLAAVAVYGVFSFELSGLRFVEFQTSNYDLGLFQQALWSSTHGRGFFESADFSLDGASSLLRIHPALSLFALSTLYGWSPTPWTLFAVQSAFAGTAAIPLFLLTRDATGSARRALAASILYLAWTPTLASNLFDFHLEVFLPLQLFTFFWLWQRRRYALGILLALSASLSFEAGATFVFLTGAYFLVEPLGQVLPRVQRRAAGETRPSDHEQARPPFGFSGWAWFRSKPVLASLGLLVLSITTFTLLLRFEASFGTLSASSPPISLGEALRGGPVQFPLTWSTLTTDLVAKVSFWIVIYGLVAFIPLWAPRTALLSLPWIVATLFGPSKFTFLGSHYGFVYAYPVFVGVALGLRRFPEDISRLSVFPSKNPALAAARVIPGWPRWRRTSGAWAILFALLIGLNLLLGPGDPLVQNSSAGNGYHLSYAPPAGFSATQRLAQLVPTGATVLASDNLMPLLANNVNAYGIFYAPANLPYLPFDFQHLPAFVMLSEVQLSDVPPWLAAALTPGSGFGLRGSVGSTAAGMVLLYQRGYSGSSENLNPTTISPMSFAWPALAVGPAARIAPPANGSGPVRIQSLVGLTGNVWYGPYVALPTGEYNVSVIVRASTLDPSLISQPNSAVLEVDSSGFASPTLFKGSYSLAVLAGGGWTQLSFQEFLVNPTAHVEIRGYQLDARVTLELSGISIAPAYR